MATKKAGSRLETEIERCRSECQWERIPELVKQLSAKLIANGARRGRAGRGRGAAAGAPGQVPPGLCRGGPGPGSGGGPGGAGGARSRAEPSCSPPAALLLRILRCSVPEGPC